MTIKQQLFNYCLAYITQRIETAQQAIKTAQSSANEETKSSAGDKYETGRAMMQLEIEKNTIQLSEAVKLKQVLDKISPDKETTKVQLGSLVTTTQGNFYIAISAGQIDLESKTYFAIASTSPMGIKLFGQTPGSEFAFNGRSFVVKEVI